jgi:hypothetical protein
VEPVKHTRRAEGRFATARGYRLRDLEPLWKAHLPRRLAEAAAAAEEQAAGLDGQGEAEASDEEAAMALMRDLEEMSRRRLEEQQQAAKTAKANGTGRLRDPARPSWV